MLCLRIIHGNQDLTGMTARHIEQRYKNDTPKYSDSFHCPKIRTVRKTQHGLTKIKMEPHHYYHPRKIQNHHHLPHRAWY